MAGTVAAAVNANGKKDPGKAAWAAWELGTGLAPGAGWKPVGGPAGRPAGAGHGGGGTGRAQWLAQLSHNQGSTSRTGAVAVSAVPVSRPDSKTRDRSENAGNWSETPETARFPVPGLHREITSRREVKPWPQYWIMSLFEWPH